jgi:dTDP-4-dehydrorhamnose reductase
MLILDDASRVGMELLPFLMDKQYRVELIKREDVSSAYCLDLIDHHSIDIVVNCYNLQSTEQDGGLTDHDIEIATAIAQRCQEQKLPLIHLSSSQVFAASRLTHYIESDIPYPITNDGKVLLAIEQVIAEQCDKYIIMRVGWVFNDSGTGVFEEMLSCLETGQELVLHAGLEGCPTPAEDVARVVVACAEQLNEGAQCYGLYHYCSSDVTTSEGFTDVIIATCKQYGRVDPDNLCIKLVDDGTMYGIPPHPVLGCLKILNHFGVKQRPWRSVMASLLKDRYSGITE